MAKKSFQQPQPETPQERIAAKKKANLIVFWKPYPWQKKLLETIREKITTAAISSNKIGKSCAAACIVISWALGYEPWTMNLPWVLDEVKAGNPNMISVKDAKGVDIWFQKSSLGIEPPVDILIAGEDWKTHIGGTIVPELKKWAPQGFYETRKNEQGVEFEWTWYNGSKFYLMSYTQDASLFESFYKHVAWEDEPPPKDKHNALSRALLLDQGKTLMTLTPLKEPWVLDDIVLAGRKDIGIVKDLMITDNPDLYNYDMGVLGNMGLDDEQKQQFLDLLLYSDKEKGKPVTDKGRGAERYLEETAPVENHAKIMLLKMLKFIKDIDPSDVPSRVFGQFKSLVGRVLKEFEDDVHKIKPFDVPTDWPVTVMIDFHLSTPQAISYWAVNRQDINYCIAETWKNLSADEIADDIIKKIRGYGWRIMDAYIDPLSKGDTAYMKNALGTDIKDTFSILDERLRVVGIRLHVATKDKESGIMNIRTWLNGPNNMPTCYLFEDCEWHFYEVARWVYDDDGKPIKENDHFMENWYRYTLTGAKYTKLRAQGEELKAETDFNPYTGAPVPAQSVSMWG